jgi:hypothetical protein
MAMAERRRGRYHSGVATLVNLADPTYEPSDEDFVRLMRTSFAGLRRAREESLREMRERILALQSEARAAFAAREPAPRSQ